MILDYKNSQVLESGCEFILSIDVFYVGFFNFINLI